MCTVPAAWPPGQSSSTTTTVSPSQAAATAAERPAVSAHWPHRLDLEGRVEVPSRTSLSHATPPPPINVGSGQVSTKSGEVQRA